MDGTRVALLTSSINKEIDSLLIDLLDTQTKLIESKLKMEAEMRMGYYHIAKTRYIGGSQSVNSLKLPTEHSTNIEPLALVTQQSDSQGVKFSIIREGTCSVDDDGNAKLRNRKAANLNLEKTSSPVSTNPLRLFGVLVPQSLKTAQKHFISAVDLAATCADYNSRLLAIYKRYIKLISMKNRMTMTN